MLGRKIKATLYVHMAGPFLVHINKHIPLLFKYVQGSVQNFPTNLQHALDAYRSIWSREHSIAVNFATSVNIWCFTTTSGAHKICAKIQPVSKIFSENLVADIAGEKEAEGV